MVPLCFLLLLATIPKCLSKGIDITKYGLSKEELLRNPQYHDKVFHVEMTTDSGKELLEHWAVQGFSGVLAAIATRRLPLVDEFHRMAHQKCASDAETISEHAKCLLMLESDAHRNSLRKRRKYFQKKKRGITARSKKLIVRRHKREISVRNRASYDIKNDSDLSPFGFLAKHLTDTLRIIKKKEKIAKWKTTIERISEKAKQLKKQKEIDKFLRKRVEQFSKKSSISDKKDNDPIDSDMMDIEKYVEDEDLKEMIHRKAKNMTDSERIMLMPMKLIRSAAKLGLTLTGYNTTDFDRKIVRIFSPKIMSVIDKEQKDNHIDILSPSLFALHGDGDDDDDDEGPSTFKSEDSGDLSLSNVLGKMTENTDSEKFLDFIVEATGVDEAMEKVEKKLQLANEDRGPEGQPLYFTKENITEKYPQEAKKIELFEKLDSTYSATQLKEMNRTGYTLMDRTQMELIYGNESVFRNEKFLKRVQPMSRWEMDREIMRTIDDVAKEKLKFEARRNDIVLSPITFTNFVFDPVSVSQPTILSPILAVALVGSPAIYGVMILSPWVMVPVIVSPRIFSPVVLNPFVMVPIILSPLAFNPFILCPGTLNPFVLSPLVLSPFILSPQVMTPLILTPFCLGPIILNPLALNPLILSPFVLSPTILSPQYVSAVILSPYALSPNFHSDGALVTVFASPSWMS